MMISDIDDYFTKGCGRCNRFDTPECSALRWRDGLLKLQEICLGAGLTETVKWGQPCYMHAGRNIVVFGAFRDNFRLGFFEAGLMKDPEGVLEAQGPNSKTKSIFRFHGLDQVEALRETIESYLTEAMSYAEQGLRAPKETVELDMPEELVEALDADPELAEAFHNLTPGRQRSYLFNLNGAKKPETRVSRILKFRDKILAGKGAMDR